MSLTDTSTADARSEAIARDALKKLLTDGYVVIESLLDPATTADLSDRVQRLLDLEKANPFDPGPDAPEPDEDQLRGTPASGTSTTTSGARLVQRLMLRQREEFDTPWPVSNEDVCISFIHIPTLFDGGRSQRIFNLINKDTAFARLLEHPLHAVDRRGSARPGRRAARRQRQRRRSRTRRAGRGMSTRR